MVAAPVMRVAVLGGSVAKADGATLLAVAPLLMTVGLLVLRWHEIPERFPIHWGFNGRANGWASRSVLSVFGPVLCAMLLVAAFASMGTLTGRFSHGFKGRPTMLRSMQGVLCGAAWLVSLLFCSVSSLAFVREPMIPVRAIVAGAVVCSFLLVAFTVYRGIRVPEAVLSAALHTTDDRYWKAGGLVYCNRADGALLVPKRMGYGYTMNFGRPASWLILSGIFVLVLGTPLILHTAVR